MGTAASRFAVEVLVRVVPARDDAPRAGTDDFARLLGGPQVGIGFTVPRGRATDGALPRLIS